MGHLATLAGAIGGIGLFLLGMWLMTDGLKVAAGRALQRVLERWTNTPVRGLASGFVVTGVVQSSSAVTIATIGFVNAGLLTLTQSVWVIYGANLGTTVTSWLIVLAGTQIRVEAFALPLVGLGMLLRVIRPGGRLGAWGQAAAGFGVFFLGIAVLKDAFSASALFPAVDALAVESWWSVAAFLGAGVLLAFLTQSSSATIAIALTAVAGGAIAIAPAAGMVIGASVGTTTTALLATIGATPNARRVAVCHVAFNLLTGIVAFSLLPPLLLVVEGLTVGVDPAAAAAWQLAVFHTLFKVLGVLIMWPITGRLVQLVSGRFRTRGEADGRPQYLDGNLLAVPDLAVRGVVNETRRLGAMVLAAARDALRSPGAGAAAVQPPALELARAIRQFMAAMNQGQVPREVAALLPDILRAIQHYQEIAIGTQRLAATAASSAAGLRQDLAEAMADYRAAVLQALDGADTAQPDVVPDAAEVVWGQVDAAYQALKALLLEEAAGGRIAVDRVDGTLDAIAFWRRIAYCAVRAARRLGRGAADSHAGDAAAEATDIGPATGAP